jgi:hypothetical protein
MQRIGATCQPCAFSLFPRAPIRPGVIELAQPPILSLAARAGHVFASWDEILIGSWNSPSFANEAFSGAPHPQSANPLPGPHGIPASSCGISTNSSPTCSTSGNASPVGRLRVQQANPVCDIQGRLKLHPSGTPRKRNLLNWRNLESDAADRGSAFRRGVREQPLLIRNDKSACGCHSAAPSE